MVAQTTEFRHEIEFEPYVDGSERFRAIDPLDGGYLDGSFVTIDSKLYVCLSFGRTAKDSPTETYIREDEREEISIHAANMSNNDDRENAVRYWLMVLSALKYKPVDLS